MAMMACNFASPWPRCIISWYDGRSSPDFLFSSTAFHRATISWYDEKDLLQIFFNLNRILIASCWISS
ncbi:hypothetical protein L195_g061787 [Trifolium pratense]|uniref:Uncharacterized protein n=1 Tax=Trifolium pratense TaxID=57577 RepID=A0A2K3KBT8_TRIPR|nr:hypothetical protein L195_g061787 [Trifolium pratense]